MSSQVAIDPEVIRQLSTALKKCGEAQKQVERLSQARLQHVAKKLDERERYWRRLQRDNEQKLFHAEQTYQACQRRGNQQNCEPARREVLRLKEEARRIASAQASIRSLLQQFRGIEKKQHLAITRLNRALSDDIVKARVYLTQIENAVQMYQLSTSVRLPDRSATAVPSLTDRKEAARSAIAMEIRRRKDKGLKQPGLIAMQGIAGEAVARFVMGEGTYNLNQYQANYPAFDAISSREIASVKTHSQTDNIEKRIEAYFKDWKKMRGYDRGFKDGMSPGQQDANNLQSFIKSNEANPEVHVPSAMRGASDEEIESMLYSESVLRIPDDDVEPFTEWLRDHGEQPGNRILGIGLKNEDIRRIVDEFKP